VTANADLKGMPLFDVAYISETIQDMRQLQWNTNRTYVLFNGVNSNDVE